ncbi:hypothetical protein F2Q69_00039656 [Brassica cretica]|uniref:FCP1 homology domain-containing protein n=1 Tax=Brassica cretica TaxID=69181 RepID=A0A8S9N5T1_BRACR|nr:hypothetical protein F2Q69_00039656 [Brassica cretica]
MRAIEHLVEEESVIKKARMVDNVEEVPVLSQNEPVVVDGSENGQVTVVEEEKERKIEEVSASLSLAEEVDVHAKNTEKVPPLDLEKNNEASVVTRRKKLLVLDLNGLLADIVSPLADCKADINIGRRAIFKRPFCEEFLKFCFDKFEVGIWSSRKKNNVDRITEFLLGDMKRRLLFCWDMSYCATTTLGSLENRHKYVVFKDLNQLWGKHDPRLPWQKGDYNETNTVLLDDSPYKALLNPPYTAIFPQSYSHQNKSDTSLGNGGDLRLHLEKLVEAENVQDFIKKNPFGQEAITEASETWEFYREATPPPQSGSSTGISGTCLIHRPEIKVLEMTEYVLQEKLSEVLETQKALIVIDDIWREGDWDRIKYVFLQKKGCKVLLTSRNEGVALHADRQCVTFKPKSLTFEESWDLFQRIAFPMKDTSEFKIDEEMKEMGKQMIKHCGGLPLALKVLGGLLAAQYTLCEWKKIYENIGSYILGGTSFNERNVVYHVLYLSFEELLAYLKHCFLYLAHFPEDYNIDVEDLSYYWAAEGIQRPRYYAGASIREVADGYIEELVKRNMVISKRDVETSRFKTCQWHDMMREVCLLKAEEENFVEIIQGTSTANSKSSCKSRRLVVHKPDETFNVDTEVKNPSLRTLLFIKCRGWRGTSLFFTRHKLMRVLDLSRVKFEGWKVPSSIGKLIHLRYLSLFCASVNRLPSSMRNMKQLLYLNLEVHSNRVYMPNILKEMRELVYLHFPLEIKNKVKMELGNLVKLETLENFSTEHGSVDDLRDKRKWYALPNDDKEEGFFLDCIHLKKLKLYIYMPKFPDEQQFPFHLTTISLTECCLKEDPMPVLEKLLHLKEVSLLYRSFRGRRMVCSRGGFPQLQMLRIRKLEELEDWIVEEGSMQFLYTLEIDACKKLKEIPEGLRFITSLEDLSVTYMGEQWGKRLLEEGEDYHKIQHIPSVEFY